MQMITTAEFENRNQSTHITVDEKPIQVEPAWCSARCGDAFKANGRIYVAMFKWSDKDGSKRLALFDVLTLEESATHPMTLSLTRITLNILITEM